MVRVFKALGDENGLRILLALFGGRTYSVCRLAEEIGVCQPALSHHVKVLREAGLVVTEKESR